MRLYENTEQTPFDIFFVHGGRTLQDAVRQRLHEWKTLAPSNSNIQPWRVLFASAPGRDRLVAALLGLVHRGPPNISPVPESFAGFVVQVVALWLSL
jgi:hypothetical protein